MAKANTWRHANNKVYTSRFLINLVFGLTNSRVKNGWTEFV